MKKYFIIIFAVIMCFLASPVEALEISRNNFLILDSYQKIVCGDNEVPYIAAQITSTVYMILQIATPIIIVLLGTIDLLKAVMAQKEDDIKKGQQTFVKRLFIGAGVFLVFVLVKAIIGLVAPANNNTGMWNCVDCFVSGDNCTTKEEVDFANIINKFKNINIGDSVSQVNSVLGVKGTMEGYVSGILQYTWDLPLGITIQALVKVPDEIQEIKLIADDNILREYLKDESVNFDKLKNMDLIAGINYDELIDIIGAEGTVFYKEINNNVIYRKYIWVDKDGHTVQAICNEDNFCKDNFYNLNN